MKMINALVWLRFKTLMKNTSVIVIALLPFTMLLLYKNFVFKDMGVEGTLLAVSSCLSMSFCVTTMNILTSTIAEEKEKNNLKSLILSGVSNLEYILSSIVIPLIMGIVCILIFPIIANADFGDHYYKYIFAGFITLIIHIFLGIVLAMFSETQMKAQMAVMPVMFITTLLPMLSSHDEQIRKICSFSYIGVYNDFFSSMSAGESVNFSMQDISILVSWSIVLFALNIFLYKKTKKGGFSLRIKTFKKEEVSI